MWRQRLQAPGILTAVVAFSSGCGDSTSPERSSVPPAVDAVVAERQVPARGIDAEFLSLARQIPGFAGISSGQPGQLIVHMKRPEMGTKVRAADVTAQVRSLASPATRGRVSSATLVVQDATYDFLQLKGWKDRLPGIFRVGGVVFVDIDEASNRVRIAITPSASEAAVVHALQSAGVPREAVIISRSSPIERVKTLSERFRPVPGGVQIVFPAPSEGPDVLIFCTLGFNARMDAQPGREFFVTASHCSDIQGGNQRTPYYQPAPQANPAVDRIAVEFKDPRYGNPAGCVYEGARCRLSDALLARYTDPRHSQFGKIARTTFGLQRIGSRLIDPNRQRWTVVGELESPIMGEIVHKVGLTSGWTRGPVIGTCIDTGVSGTDIVQLCQDFVHAGSRAGDSGSAVFELAGPNQILLAGILWGGGVVDGATVFVSSPMKNIESELGELTTTTASAAVASTD